MRRIDVLGVGLGILGVGGLVYFLLQEFGIDHLSAGIWSQVLLLAGLIGWVLSYLLRVGTHTMTYHQQLQDYEDAVLQKRLDEMSPDELTTLQAEIEQERQATK